MNLKKAEDRAKKLLEDTMKMFGDKVKITDRSAFVTGTTGNRYSIDRNEMHVRYLGSTNEKKIEVLDELDGEFICIVDHSQKLNKLDRLVSRIMALANDQTVVSQISTLQKYVNSEKVLDGGN